MRRSAIRGKSHCPFVSVDLRLCGLLLSVLSLGVVVGAQKAVEGKPPGGNPTFTLAVELKFEGRTVSGEVQKSQIESLLDLPVRNGDSDLEEGYGVELTSEKRERKKVLSCRQWKKATGGGWYAATTYDMAMEGFLIHTCDVLFALQKAKIPERLFLSKPHVGVNNLELLPANVLGTAYPELQKELLEMAKKGTTVAMLVHKGEAVVESQSPTEVRLTYGDMQQFLREAARADFNGDGFEDIMVFSGGRVVGGTMGFSDCFFLTRLQPEGRLKLINVK